MYEAFGCPHYDLRNHLTVPLFAFVSFFEEPSETYYGGWESGCLEPRFHWCVAGEILGPAHPLRPSALIRSKSGE